MKIEMGSEDVVVETPIRLEHVRDKDSGGILEAERCIANGGTIVVHGPVKIVRDNSPGAYIVNY